VQSGPVSSIGEFPVAAIDFSEAPKYRSHLLSEDVAAVYKEI